MGLSYLQSGFLIFTKKNTKAQNKEQPYNIILLFKDYINRKYIYE